MRVVPTVYTSFEARMIRATGRCPNDVEDVEPYTSPEEVDVDAARGSNLIVCPTCSLRWIVLTEIRDGSIQATPRAAEYDHFLDMLLQPKGKSGKRRRTFELSDDRVDTGPARDGVDEPAHRQSPTTYARQAPRQTSARPTVVPPAGRTTAEPSARLQASARVSLNGATVVSVQPGARRSEPLGSEQYDFDNSGSSSTSIETLQITNSTQFVLTFSLEEATERNGQASIGLFDFARVEGHLQSNVRKQHSVESTSNLTVSRTSQISIPARTHVQVTLKWRRVWQDGVITLRTKNSTEVSLPYSMTVDLSFDKTSADIG